MYFSDWLLGLFSCRGRALSRYRRGVAKARNRDREGAIVEYTAAIDMANVPPDVKAMAQYNRALVHLTNKNVPRAIDDLNLILAMQEMVVNLKTMARLKLASIEFLSQKSTL
jgi:hypothetical protein